jgi:hypothetical protein
MNLMIKRFFRRLKYVFQFSTYKWDYESCENCGKSFKIAYSVKDEIWNKVYGSEDGCLCLNCFLEKSLKKDVYIKPDDIEWLSLFYGDEGYYNIKVK